MIRERLVPSAAGRFVGRASKSTACVLLGALAAAQGGRTEDAVGTDSAALPNVLLVVLDTVRADHLSCYGYSRPTTPAIDAFANRATRFTRALSSAPWTLPSHASMFTGLDPEQHRVHTVMTPEGEVTERVLDERFHTLAEGFSELGYRTAAFIANDAYLQPKFGLNQGFATYEVRREPGVAVNRRALRWARRNDARPWFLFVNYMDAHRPYRAKPRQSVVSRPIDRADSIVKINELIRVVLPGEGEVPADLAQQVIDMYDLGVASADEAFGQLLHGVEAMDGSAGTLVVVTSDHGEYFGEHHLVEHSKDVYQPAIWVPLVIGVLGSDALAEDSRVVTSSDLPRLMLAAAGNARLDPLRARFPAPPEGRLPRIFNAYSRPKDVHNQLWGHRFRRVRRATLDWPWKLIVASDGQRELYHLERDPHELDNRIEARPDIASRLTQLLAEMEGGAVPGQTDEAPPAMTPEELERMRALGYVE